MRVITTADPIRFMRMSTTELRASFLLEDLFAQGSIELAYTDLDRAVIGSAVPLAHDLTLEADAELRSNFFCERRELGVLNIGGAGEVQVDDEKYAMDRLDCLYVGKGTRSVVFHSRDTNEPACFYLLSYPAHTSYTSALARYSESKGLSLGASETGNARTLHKCIYADGIQSCQLVMGYTLLDQGSCWNTMPPHTHLRRSEIYMYFDLDPAHRVLHLMGPSDETRHLVIANRQVALSPPWSIHAGAGTARYGFCWGMGGENQAFDDMDGVPVAAIR